MAEGRTRAEREIGARRRGARREAAERGGRGGRPVVAGVACVVVLFDREREKNDSEMVISTQG
jgi:hypothetical protein